MAFDEVQFPTDISRGSRGGPEFSTDIVRVNNGYEVRSAQWQDPLFKFNASYGVKRYNQLQTLHDFFLAVQGQVHGFRYKNWLDYMATNEPTGTSVAIDGGAFDGVTPRNGSRQLQLRRLYSHASRNYTKDIRKPLAANPAVTIRRDTVSFTDFSIDTTTGVITLDLTAAEHTQALSADPTSSPIEVTWNSHPLVTGDIIWIEGETVRTGWNSKTWVVTVTGANTFTFSSTDTGGSHSGGTVYVFPQSPNFVRTFDWSGQFDLPVRFGLDFLDVTLDGPDIGDIPNIPILETRDFL